MKTFLRFNVFQLLLIAVVGLSFQNSYGQVSIATHNVNVTTALTGWNGTLPNGFTVISDGNYIGSTVATNGGLYAVANGGFGYQASSGVASVELKGTFKNTTGSAITSVQISYQAFIIFARDSRKPNWTVTSSLGAVSGLNWTYNDSNRLATNPVTKTVTLSGLNVPNNATFTLTFSSDRGTGTGSSSMIGLRNIIVKSVVPTIVTDLNSLTFDDTQIGTTSVAKTVVVGTTSATGTVTATAPTNFEVSSNGTTWGSTATLATTGATLHVRFSPSAVGLLTGNITLSTAGATDKLIAVSGTGIGSSASITTDIATFGPFCNSDATVLNVNFTTTGTFTDTNFSVQLSDATGTFPATATNIIGTGTTSPINATIPSNTIAGTNYRMRVLNADPLTISNDNGSNISIIGANVGGTISGGTSVCGVTNSGTLTLENHVGDVTKWQSSTSQDFSVSVNDIANTTTTLTFSNLTETTYFRAVVNNGICASDNSSTATINFSSLTTPDFAQIPAFCSGSTAPLLTLTSPNGITGTWNPATVSNTIAGNYIFTPDAGQCASQATLTTNVTELTIPDFAQIPAFCSGSTAPVLTLTSPNGITGTWNPATVSNTENGTYVFTPDAGQCASQATLTTNVTELTAPDFAQIPAFCSGSTAPLLTLTSPNGITGTWNPATVSNTEDGTYVFTPDAGQCASQATLTTNVTELTIPDFAQIPAFCSGSTAPLLTLTSPNGITGTWNPATVSNTIAGNYIFTPDAGQCASTVTLTTLINVTLPPTGTATQDFTGGQTLEDFIVVGENIKWYDAATGGNELQNSEIIVSGTIYYVSQTINGCESLRLPITAGNDLGTDSFKLANLKYYPNPTDQILNLEYSQTISSVAVYNLLGQQVLIANPNNTTVKVDLSNLNSGTYFLNIQSENNSKTIKVVKK